MWQFCSGYGPQQGASVVFFRRRGTWSIHTTLPGMWGLKCWTNPRRLPSQLFIHPSIQPSIHSECIATHPYLVVLPTVTALFTELYTHFCFSFSSPPPPFSPPPLSLRRRIACETVLVSLAIWAATFRVLGSLSMCCTVVCPNSHMAANAGCAF